MSSSLLKHPCRRVLSGVGCATFFFFSTIAVAETASSLSWLDSALEDTLFELRGYTDAYHFVWEFLPDILPNLVWNWHCFHLHR